MDIADFLPIGSAQLSSAYGLVGYDNERGRGDHRHIEGEEQPYSFSTPERLIDDFLADVRRLRGE